MKYIYRMLSNIFKPWKKGQSALWYRVRNLEKAIATLDKRDKDSHKFQMFELEALSAKIGEFKKPKRGRPRKKL